MELTISDLTKDFGSFRAVDQVTFTMHSGVYGLLGVNGAGKTTLMRMLTTLIHPTGGEIRWDGQDVFRMDSAYRKLLGYLPQDFGYYPDFSIYDYLMYIASIKGIRPAAAKQRALRLLKQVGLSQTGHKKMKTLSGGMKRRVGIAQAMLNDPKILILDDSVSAVDTRTEKIILDNLKASRAGKTTLLIAHRISTVEGLDKIIFLEDGRVEAVGPHDSLYASCPEYRRMVDLQRLEDEVGGDSNG